jgi:hypothetical protein
MRYLIAPKIVYTFTFGAATSTIEDLASGQIVMGENAYWTATLTFKNDTAINPAVICAGATVSIGIQDSAFNSGVWATLFVGSVLFADTGFTGESLPVVTLQCVGLGYALNMMNCAEEYGTQSRNSAVDTLLEILTDATVGVIPKWVNKYKGGTKDSGYSINTANVENLAESIAYIV